MKRKRQRSLLSVKIATITKWQRLSTDQRHVVLTGGINWDRRKRGPFAGLCCLGPLQCPGTTRHHGPKCHLTSLLSLRYLPFGSGKRMPEGFHHLRGLPLCQSLDFQGRAGSPIFQSSLTVMKYELLESPLGSCISATAGIYRRRLLGP